MSAVGPLLSEYRRKSRLSQLDLSLLADVSSRHISFIETGRSNPSRAMLLRLADVMDLSLGESNLLLNSGGYAAAYSEFDIHSEAMKPVRDALSLMLDNHDPFPAIVIDGNWNIVMVNKSQQRVAAQVSQQAQNDFPTNLLEAVFREDAYKPFIQNWDVVAAHTLRRLRKQVLAYGKSEHAELYQRLLQLSPPENWQQPEQMQQDGPMLTVDFVMGGQVLSMFSTLSQFGTSLDTGVEELVIESYFPATEACKTFFESLADS